MNNWQKINLGGEWKLAYISHGELKNAPISYNDVLTHPSTISATVPGNYEIDLENAGIIEDPFYASNLLKMRKWEQYHFFYARKFTYKPLSETKPIFIFEGLDTIADIYLNGKRIAQTENMFIIHEVEPEGIIEGENDLLIHFKPVCIEARNNAVSAGNYHLPYNYESLRLRKSAHSFAWDIMPRLVTAGIYRPACLAYRPIEHTRQIYIQTKSVDLHNNTAELELFYDFHIENPDLTGYLVTIEGKSGNSVFEKTVPLWFIAGKETINVSDAKFWWPKGYGDQNLYDVTITLKHCDKIVDVYKTRLGLRTVKLIRDSVTDSLMTGDFHFEVNGKRIFILGTNWVPVDALHSRDRSRLPKIMDLLEDVGCNTIRIWGGNVYEDNYLYDRCDEMGILIWQDFCMACGIYPIDSDFQNVMEHEALVTVRRLRQHPSILIWAGDNECDMFAYFQNSDPNINIITRKIFANVCAMEDPSRPYLPSSPYIDEAAYKLPMEYLPENHPWGPRDYFRSNYYNNLLCSFASEIGYHGCNSVESIKKFISPEKLWPYYDNEDWLVHAASPQADGNGPYAYRIELMAKQIRELFGSIPDNLEDFVLASQISQAEAKKHFVETFRGDKPKRSGLIWWNLIDGWPQFSDAVADYYYDKKLAYYYIKMTQKPFILSVSEPSNWNCDLRAVNDSGKSLVFSYTVRDFTEGGKIVCEGKNHIGGDEVIVLEKLPYSYGHKKLYVIEWECGEYSGKNHYMAGNPPFDLEWYRDFLQQTYGQEGIYK